MNINKIDKPLVRFTKKKREKAQINNLKLHLTELEREEQTSTKSADGGK